MRQKTILYSLISLFVFHLSSLQPLHFVAILFQNISGQGDDLALSQIATDELNMRQIFSTLKKPSYFRMIIYISISTCCGVAVIALQAKVSNLLRFNWIIRVTNCDRTI